MPWRGGGGSGTGRAGGRTPSVVAGQDANSLINRHRDTDTLLLSIRTSPDAVSINPLISLEHNDMERIMAIMANSGRIPSESLDQLGFQFLLDLLCRQFLCHVGHPGGEVGRTI